MTFDDALDAPEGAGKAAALEDALAAIEKQFGGSQRETHVDAYAATESLEPTLRAFLGEITVNARLLVRAIAHGTLERNGAIPSAVLRDRLGAENDGTMGGWAASIGFAIKRSGLPKPYWRSSDIGDSGAWEPAYKMRAHIARGVIEILDEDGKLRPGPSAD